MEMFLQDMVRLCAAIALLGGMFLGWLVTKCREGIAWKAPLWHDGKKWRTIEPSLEGDTMENSEIHPVRFTNKQVDFIKHLLCEFSEYFEEENADLSDHIEKAEEKGPWHNAEGKKVCSTEG